MMKSSASAQLSLATSVSEVLPKKDPELAREQAEIKRALEEVDDRGRELASEFRAEAFSVSHESPNKAALQKLGRGEGELPLLLESELDVQIRVSEFSNKVSAEGQRQHEEIDRTLARSTVGMYALFSVGWGLGLIGKLLKLPTLGSTEQ